MRSHLFQRGEQVAVGGVGHAVTDGQVRYSLPGLQLGGNFLGEVQVEDPQAWPVAVHVELDLAHLVHVEFQAVQHGERHRSP